MSNEANKPRDQDISEFGRNLKERLVSLLNSADSGSRNSLAPFLAQCFGVSRTQGYRLLENLDQSVTLDRLELLCRHFDTTPDALLKPDKPDTMLVNAAVALQDGTLHCTASIDQMPAALHAGLGAWRTSTGWQIGLGRAGAHPVREVVINTQQAARPVTVAVLDDDYDAAETWMDVLVDNGYDATAYGMPKRLFEAVDEGCRFDVLILDWQLGTTTGDEVIKRLQEKSACPEHVLILSGVQQDYSQQITEAIRAVRAYPMVKPVQKDILLATLKTKIEETR